MRPREQRAIGAAVASVAKRMAGRAAHRARHVVAAVHVAGHAGRAIAARSALVRRVAARAGRVACRAVQAGQLAGRMTARTRRRRRRPRAGVRRVAGGARARAAVRRARLREVAARARRDRARGMRCVAVRALRVTGRRAAGLDGMAARARGRLRARPRRVGGMAGLARGVARAAGGGRSIGVAARARRRADLRSPAVRDVAVEAGRGAVRDGAMTARARHRARHAGDVRRMATRAGAGRRRRVRDDHRVTARARARRVVVRRVTRRAGRMRARREHGPIAVAGDARLHLGRGEAVRRVAAGAARMPRGARGRADRARADLRGVAARAAIAGRVVRAVDTVAIHAAPRAGVAGRLRRVALGARRGCERWRVVRAMALRARLLGVSRHRRHAALRGRVAAHARRRRSCVGAERVTVLARRHRRVAVQRRGHRGVAARAQLGRRWREVVAVAVRARDLADVGGVARAGLHGAIARRYLRRRAGLALATRGHHEDHEQRARHGRDPIG